LSVTREKYGDIRDYEALLLVVVDRRCVVQMLCKLRGQAMAERDVCDEPRLWRICVAAGGHLGNRAREQWLAVTWERAGAKRRLRRGLPWACWRARCRRRILVPDVADRDDHSYQDEHGRCGQSGEHATRTSVRTGYLPLEACYRE
jgi:hypothetical protein